MPETQCFSRRFGWRGWPAAELRSGGVQRVEPAPIQDSHLREDELQQRSVEAQAGHELPQRDILAGKLLQPARLGRHQAVVTDIRLYVGAA